MNEYGFRHFASRNSDAPAIIEQNGTTWSRGALLELADGVARGLAAAGLEPGDVVAIVAPNCAEYVATYLAGISAGLYIVPINWHLAAPEIDYLIDNSRAKAIVAHAMLGNRRLDALRAHGARTKAAVSIGTADGFRELRAFAARATIFELDPNRPMGRVLPYTSATTGVPKAVWRSLDGAPHAMRKFVEWHLALGVSLEDDNVHLCTAMLYHAAPLEGVRNALEMGHVVVLMESSDPSATLSAIERFRVTTAFMVPTLFVRLLQLPAEERESRSVRSLRFVVHGGAPCPPDVKRRMLAWWGPILWEAYGATEAQGTIVSSAEWLRRPGTVGRAIAGSRLSILDDSGRELPPFEIGLVFLAPYTGERFEYLGDEAKTRACVRGDLVCAGDRGFVDADGYLFLCGRESDLIISSGVNIYPAEIENALIAHPAVVDCAVIGSGDPLLGQTPRAIVQLRSDAVPSIELTRDLFAFLSTRIAAMKLPRRIEYRHHVPRDANGKLLRRALLEETAP
ncbi:MAG TPA: AMP-binding protein [Gammaproteobacteria bacterium]|nr:AMP-binding protein [Gammaproteobacteria bacterium]